MNKLMQINKKIAIVFMLVVAVATAVPGCRCRTRRSS